MKKILSLLVFVAVAACSNLPRQYDGHLGYQIIDKQPNVVQVKNTLEHDRTSVASEKTQLLNLCAKELGVDAADVKVTNVNSRIQVKKIPMTTQVVGGVAPAAAGGGHAGGGIYSGGVQTQTDSETQLREMNVRETEVTCKR